MPTEREVLLQILQGNPNGSANLFERHGALFRAGLMRFYGDAGLDQTNRLAQMMRILASQLKEGRFDDLKETFYDWIVRTTWCIFMKWIMEEEGRDEFDPEILFASADPLDFNALPEEVRNRHQMLVEQDEFYEMLYKKCQNIPLEVRHAGAPISEEFRGVIQEALKNVD